MESGFSSESDGKPSAVMSRRLSDSTYILTGLLQLLN